MAKGFKAEERSTFIGRAIAHWQAIIRADGEPQGAGRIPAYWNERYGYWAFFGLSDANTTKGHRYWNTFGLKPGAPRARMLVEINPPEAGVAGGTQGLVALDDKGKRWILHGGRIHPGRDRVDTETFGQLSGLQPVSVRFSDGSTRPYYLVAPLDGGAEALHASLSRFVERCGYVRDIYLKGREQADLEASVANAEESSTPEKTGGYVIPPRGSAQAERVHADVWKALAAALDRRRVKHSNARVGRYGPDLRTLKAPFVLFEIKTDRGARSVYEALGQLLTYERLLKNDYHKVLIVPARPSAKLAEVLDEYDVAILTYTKKGRSYVVDGKALSNLLSSV